MRNNVDASRPIVRRFRGGRRTLVAAGATLLIAPVVAAVPAAAAPGDTARVSVGVNGEADKASSTPLAVSGDNRFVAFPSEATNLVHGDTNAASDIFVHDRQTVTTTRVSVNNGGIQGDKPSREPFISADGRFVTFSSEATNLVCSAEVPAPLCDGTGDTNAVADVFVHDRDSDDDDVFDETGAVATTRVSVGSDGAEGNAFSGATGLSASGRYVVFGSGASNLVDGDTNGANDVFVHDRDSHTTTRVSLGGESTQGNASTGGAAISDDGRVVAFTSSASNLVASDTNGVADVFVRDRDLDADGVLDEAGAVETTRVSTDNGGLEGNGASTMGHLSGDGTVVVFGSNATNLVAGDFKGHHDVFVHDRTRRVTTRVSVDSAGNEADNASSRPTVSTDGRYVSFSSIASNLVEGDTQVSWDVYAHDRSTADTTMVSVNSEGTRGSGVSLGSTISRDGRFVAFASTADDLVLGDANGVNDIFLHERRPDIVISCGGLTPTIWGTHGNDLIAGTRGPDVIAGLGGNDNIDGAKGNDVICGGSGDDTLYGSGGDDVLDGGPGIDSCDGGPARRDEATACENVLGVP